MHSPKYKASRALGCNLWGREKDPYNFKNYKPGQHGQTAMRSTSRYGMQLLEKQKLRRYCNILEKQFRNIVLGAVKKLGNTEDNIVNSLERRLDMVLYRANFVPTVFAARQLVSHRHVMVNGKVVNIRSMTLRDGDVVSLSSSGSRLSYTNDALKASARRVPDYLSFDADKKSVTFLRKPSFTEVPYEVQMDIVAIIEFYAR